MTGHLTMTTAEMNALEICERNVLRHNVSIYKRSRTLENKKVERDECHVIGEMYCKIYTVTRTEIL